ncbi:uncharacterized metal-dependent hydrolase YcfH-like [Argopecten irradians]|uniref:uncharacterized metal-dependent hydrolase YcfH-like n=1 Tax=Argopecten irradians TaxID=31199 RepID=UPI003723B441
MYPGWEVTPLQQQAMEDVCRVQGWEIPGEFSLDPVNSPAALIHWRCLVVVANALAKSTLDEFRAKYAEAIHQTTETRTAPPEEDAGASDSKGEMDGFQQVMFAFDSHFHLDRLRNKLQLNSRAVVSDIVTRLPETSAEVRVEVAGAVAVYCDPSTYPEEEEIQLLRQENVRVVVGIHPKKYLTAEDLDRLKVLLTVPGVVGLGEVGIDHTVQPPEHWYYQERQLKSLLQFLPSDKVLVLHIRGTRGDKAGVEAYMRCLDILEARVDRHQKIQLHCFTGTAHVVECWRIGFPNTHFSFSGIMAQFSEEQKEGLRSIPKENLLIETDAPYFPLCQQHQWSAPHFLNRTAQAVADVLEDMTVEEVMELTERNGVRFFGPC